MKNPRILRITLAVLLLFASAVLCAQSRTRTRQNAPNLKDPKAEIGTQYKMPADKTPIKLLEDILPEYEEGKYVYLTKFNGTRTLWRVAIHESMLKEEYGIPIVSGFDLPIPEEFAYDEEREAYDAEKLLIAFRASVIIPEDAVAAVVCTSEPIFAGKKNDVCMYFSRELGCAIFSTAYLRKVPFVNVFNIARESTKLFLSAMFASTQKDAPVFCRHWKCVNGNTTILQYRDFGVCPECEKKTKRAAFCLQTLRKEYLPGARKWTDEDLKNLKRYLVTVKKIFEKPVYVAKIPGNEISTTEYNKRIFPNGRMDMRKYDEYMAELRAKDPYKFPSWGIEPLKKSPSKGTPSLDNVFCAADMLDVEQKIVDARSKKAADTRSSWRIKNPDRSPNKPLENVFPKKIDGKIYVVPVSFGNQTLIQQLSDNIKTVKRLLKIKIELLPTFCQLPVVPGKMIKYRVDDYRSGTGQPSDAETALCYFRSSFILPDDAIGYIIVYNHHPLSIREDDCKAFYFDSDLGGGIISTLGIEMNKEIQKLPPRMVDQAMQKLIIMSAMAIVRNDAIVACSHKRCVNCSDFEMDYSNEFFVCRDCEAKLRKIDCAAAKTKLHEQYPSPAREWTPAELAEIDKYVGKAKEYLGTFVEEKYSYECEEECGSKSSRNKAKLAEFIKRMLPETGFKVAPWGTKPLKDGASGQGKSSGKNSFGM